MVGGLKQVTHGSPAISGLWVLVRSGPGPVCLHISEILFYYVASHLSCPFTSFTQAEAELAKLHHLKV